MIAVQMTGAKVEGAQRTVDLMASRLTDFRVPLAAAGEFVREQTRQRYEARGFGEWPMLAESTVARKESLGYPDPTRQLYAEGDLFESVTSENGPYSYTVLEPTFIVIGVDWSVNGWQIGAVLSQGTDDAGVNHTTRIPARPIWPDSRLMLNGVSRIVRNWVRASVEPLALGGGGGVWEGADTPPL
jgi:hypothetical protein